MKKFFYSVSFSKILLAFFVFVLLFENACNRAERKKRVGFVYVIEKSIRTPADIMPVTKPLVIPYVYSNTCSLDTLPVPKKKQKFFDLMLPPVLVAKTNLDLARKKVEKLAGKQHLSHGEKDMLSQWYRKFKTRDIHVLLKRMHTFPVSIVLAQAAIESGWGSSRFFLQGNNPFGIWSFDPKHQRLTADSTRNGTKVYLRKFDDLEQAIENYYLLLATGRPFAAFREVRMKTDNPDTLVRTLTMYSERREAYVNQLAQMIHSNRLTRYDHYKIAPAFLKKEKVFHLFPD
jgi:Bax protein